MPAAAWCHACRFDRASTASRLKPKENNCERGVTVITQAQQAFGPHAAPLGAQEDATNHRLLLEAQEKQLAASTQKQDVRRGDVGLGSVGEQTFIRLYRSPIDLTNSDMLACPGSKGLTAEPLPRFTASLCAHVCTEEQRAFQEGKRQLMDREAKIVIYLTLPRGVRMFAQRSSVHSRRASAG
eukprot:1148571-Pelagomonas_calceolata.AAC.9